MNVVGLDLSLRSTGIADADGTVRVVRTSELRGMQRIDVIQTAVVRALDGVDLVAVEGYAMAARGRSVFALGEVGGVVRHTIWVLGHAWIDVPPTSLKRYATGRGDANKIAMVIAARDRLGYEGGDTDEADALWLRAIGLAVAGAPLVKLPQTHLAALAGVQANAGRPTMQGETHGR